MGTAVSPKRSEAVESGAYLTDQRRLFRVVLALDAKVLLEDCRNPNQLEWWAVPAVLQKLTLVRRR